MNLILWNHPYFQVHELVQRTFCTDWNEIGVLLVEMVYLKIKIKRLQQVGFFLPFRKTKEQLL